MDITELDNALAFGSATQIANDGTLANFGLGLKLATSFLGRRLFIVTRSTTGRVLKAVLDFQAIVDDYKY
jgi:hypothetical protein